MVVSVIYTSYVATAPVQRVADAHIVQVIVVDAEVFDLQKHVRPVSM